MPVFAYRAADRRGQTVDGVMDAPDARAVIERLHREAYFPVKVTPQTRRTWGEFSLSRGIKARDLLALTQQLATLVGIQRVKPVYGYDVPPARVDAPGVGRVVPAGQHHDGVGGQRRYEFVP